MTNSPAIILDRLRALKSECGPDRHDQATVLITACILEGLNTGERIVGALTELGMTPGHVWIMLKKHTGSNPARHHWRCDESGTYSLLEACQQQAA